MSFGEGFYRKTLGPFRPVFSLSIEGFPSPDEAGAYGPRTGRTKAGKTPNSVAILRAATPTSICPRPWGTAEGIGRRSCSARSLRFRSLSIRMWPAGSDLAHAEDPHPVPRADRVAQPALIAVLEGLSALLLDAIHYFLIVGYILHGIFQSSSYAA